MAFKSLLSRDRRKEFLANNKVNSYSFGATKQSISITDLISEGPIQGLVNGAASVFLNNDTVFDESEITYQSAYGIQAITNTSGNDTFTVVGSASFDVNYSTYLNQSLVLSGFPSLTVSLTSLGDSNSGIGHKFALNWDYSQSAETLPTHTEFGADPTEYVSHVSEDAEGKGFFTIDLGGDSSRRYHGFFASTPDNTSNSVNVVINTLSSDFALSNFTSGTHTLNWNISLSISSINGSTIETKINPGITISADRAVEFSIPKRFDLSRPLFQKYIGSGYQFNTGTINQPVIRTPLGVGSTTKELSVANVRDLSRSESGVITATATSQASEIDKVQLEFRYPGGLIMHKTENGKKYQAGAAYAIFIRFDTSEGDGTNYGDYIPLEGNFTLNDAQAVRDLNTGGTIVSQGDSLFAHGGKFQSAVSFYHTIDLEPYQPFVGFQIKVRRVTNSEDLTDNQAGRAHVWNLSTSDGRPVLGWRGTDVDKWQAVQSGGVNSATGIITEKVNYPYTAVANVTFGSTAFDNTPSRTYDCYGLKVQVPSNYTTREAKRPLLTSGFHDVDDLYEGIWDGTFKTEKEYTDNPAWVFYDILTNNRYGVGQYVRPEDIDKWSLYKIARYCDELVPDGKGGTEPRFRANIYLQKATDVYKVLKDMATIFRGIIYWGDGKLFPVIDEKKHPVYTFTKANVVDGAFNYESTASKTRTNQMIVQWNNPDADYKLEPLIVEDRQNIVETGEINQEEATAFGCTSEGQAIRYGRWKLWTAINQTELVEFKTAYNAAFLSPGDVINIQDNHQYNLQFSGRVSGFNSPESGLTQTFTLPPGKITQGNYEVSGSTDYDAMPMLFAGEAVLPKTFSQDACLWEHGGTGVGAYLGVRLKDSVYQLAVRAGSGSTGQQQSLADTVVAYVPISDIPQFDGDKHTIAWEIDTGSAGVRSGRVRVWIDNVLYVDESTTGSNTVLEGTSWSGGNEGGWGQAFSTQAGGWSNNAWPTAPTTNLRHYSNQLVANTVNNDVLTIDREVEESASSGKLFVVIPESKVVLSQASASINNTTKVAGEKVTQAHDESGTLYTFSYTTSESAYAQINNAYDENGKLLSLQYNEGTSVLTGDISSMSSREVTLSSSSFTPAQASKMKGAVYGIQDRTASEASPKEYKIVSIVKESDNTFGITAIEYYESKFDNVDYNFTLAQDDPIAPPPKTTDTVPVARKVQVRQNDGADQASEELVLTWDAPTGNNLNVFYEVEHNVSNYQQNPIRTTDTELVFSDIKEGGTFSFVVRTVDERGRKSTPVVRSTYIDEEVIESSQERLFGLKQGGYADARAVIDTTNDVVKFEANTTVFAPLTGNSGERYNFTSASVDYSVLSSSEVAYVLADVSANELILIKHLEDTALGVSYWYDRNITTAANRWTEVSQCASYVDATNIEQAYFETADGSENFNSLLNHRNVLRYATSTMSTGALVGYLSGSSEVHIDRELSVSGTNAVLYKDELSPDFTNDFIIGSIDGSGNWKSYLNIDPDLASAKTVQINTTPSSVLYNGSAEQLTSNTFAATITAVGFRDPEFRVTLDGVNGSPSTSFSASNGSDPLVYNFTASNGTVAYGSGSAVFITASVREAADTSQEFTAKSEIVKIKEGVQGTDGKQAATGLVYYQVASASQPTTPSATSYTFSTGQFTSLSNNWAKTPPNLDGTDGQFWVSEFNVVETTAGGDSGTPTFQSSKSSTNFTDVVVVSDLGSGGTTVIDGDRISTGSITISSGNLSGIKSGKANYGDSTTGFFLGIDNDDAKFNIGNSTESLKWTGSSVEIKGSLAGDTLEVNQDGRLVLGASSTIAGDVVATSVKPGGVNISALGQDVLSLFDDRLSTATNATFSGYYVSNSGKYKAQSNSVAFLLNVDANGSEVASVGRGSGDITLRITASHFWSSNTNYSALSGSVEFLYKLNSSSTYTTSGSAVSVPYTITKEFIDLFGTSLYLYNLEIDSEQKIQGLTEGSDYDWALAWRTPSSTNSPIQDSSFGHITFEASVSEAASGATDTAGTSNFSESARFARSAGFATLAASAQQLGGVSKNGFFRKYNFISSASGDNISWENVSNHPGISTALPSTGSTGYPAQYGFALHFTAGASASVSETARAFQLFKQNDVDQLHFRTFSSDAAGAVGKPWHRFLTTNDEGSGNGIDADTVDGKNASDFVNRTDAQTIAGNKTFSNNVTINGNLDINGTLTSLDSSTVSISAKQIVVARNATNNTQANGAGLFVEGPDASLLYNSTTDEFDLNHSLKVTGSTSSMLTLNQADTAKDAILNLGVSGDYIRLRSSRSANNQINFHVGRAYSNGGSAEYITVRNDGLVGVGKTAPAYDLDVDGTVNASSLFRLGNQKFAETSGGYQKVGPAGGALGLQLRTASSGVAMTILSDNNNVGFGTSSPNTRVHVEGAMYVDGGTYSTAQESSGSAGIVLAKGSKILTETPEGYLRNIIEYGSDSDIKIGQSATALIRNIDLHPGSEGNINLHSVSGRTLPSVIVGSGKDGVLTRPVVAAGGVGFHVGTNNVDVTVLRVEQRTDASTSTASSYGFSLDYDGAGTGNNNNLVLRADNQLDNQKDVFTVHQDGTTEFHQSLTFSSSLVARDRLNIEYPDGNGNSIRVGRADASSYWGVNHAGNDFRLYNTDGAGRDVLIGADAGSSIHDNKLGVGIPSPGHKLHVESESNVQMQLSTNSSAYNARMVFSPNRCQRWNMGVMASNSEFTWYDIGAATTPFRIEQGAPNSTLAVDSNGRVGIRTNSPATHLQVGSTAVSADYAARVYFYNDYTEMRGYGIQFNRSTSYLRPTTNADKNLIIGGTSLSADNTAQQWNSVEFRSSNVFFRKGPVTVDKQNLTIKTESSNTKGLLIFDNVDGSYNWWNYQNNANSLIWAVTGTGGAELQLNADGSSHSSAELIIGGGSTVGGKLNTYETDTGTVIVRGNGQTIGSSTFANAWLKIGSGTAGIGMDNNEIFFNGVGTGFIGTLDESDLRILTNAGTALTVTGSSRNVGIGVTNPARKLVVNSASSADMVIAGGTGSNLYFRPTTAYSTAGNFGILVSGSSSGVYKSTMKFTGYSGGVNNVLTLKGDQKIGIGSVTNPTQTLDMEGVAKFRGTSASSKVMELGMLDSASTSTLVTFYCDDVGTDNFRQHIGRYSASYSWSRGSYAGQPVSMMTIATDTSGDASRTRLSLFTQDNSRTAASGGSTAAVERLRLMSNGSSYINGGYLGLGISDPTAKLHVYGSEDTAAIFQSGDNKALITIKDNDTTVHVSAENARAAFGFQAGTHKNNLNLDNLGRVYIGTTTSIDNNAKLQIVSESAGMARIAMQDIDGTNQKTFFQQSGGNTSLISQNGTSYGNFGVYGYDGTTTEEKFHFDVVNGRLGINTTTPNRRLHIVDSNVGVPTQYGVAVIESADAQMDLVSSSAGTWGSAINFVESKSAGANHDVWSIVRQTTQGSGDGSLRINYGTGNNHQNSLKLHLTQSGKLALGKESPSNFLDINAGAENVPARFRSTDNRCQLQIDDNDTSAFVGAEGSRTFIGMNSGLGSNNVVIDASGNVTLGHTGAAETKLDVFKASTTAYTYQMSGVNAYTPSGGDILQVQNTSSSSDSLWAGIWFETGFPKTNTTGTNRPGRMALLVDNSTAYASNFVWQLRDSSAALTEQMRLTHDGKLGIGTRAPQGLLHLRSPNNVGDAVLIVEADNDNNVEQDNPRIELRQDGNNVAGYLYMEHGPNGTANGTIANHVILESKGSTAEGIQFVTGGLAPAQSGGPTSGGVRMTIQGDGDIGIGTTTPQAPLHISKSGSVSALHALTILKLTRDFEEGDINQQKSFIDFEFLDSNDNQVPQVRIGAEVGQNGDANSQLKEGSGAFVIYTNNSNSESGQATTSLAERMRVDYTGRALFNATSTAFNDKIYVNGDGYATGGWRTGTAATFVGEMTNASGKLAIQTAANRDIQLGDTANPSIFYVDTSAQAVGIGTTGPDKALVVSASGSNAEIVIDDSAGGPSLRFRDNGTTIGTVNASGDTGALTFTSRSSAIHFDDGTFRPFSADGGTLDLGTEDVRWNRLYLDNAINYGPRGSNPSQVLMQMSRSVAGVVSTVTLMQRHTESGAVSFGADDALIIGAGEARATIVSNVPGGLAAERLHLGAESGIYFFTHPNNWQGTGWASRNEMSFSQSGLLAVSGGGTFGDDVTITGQLNATTKSFLIDHPTKEGMKLRYGSLEGPENGVYVRGRATTNVIELPEYWVALVDETTITAQLTPNGRFQKLFVDKIENNKVYLKNASWFSNKIDCYYNIYGERKDVEKLKVEY